MYKVSLKFLCPECKNTWIISKDFDDFDDYQYDFNPDRVETPCRKCGELGVFVGEK